MKYPLPDILCLKSRNQGIFQKIDNTHSLSFINTVYLAFINRITKTPNQILQTRTNFNACSTKHMKKSKYFLVIILTLMAFISCADDNEFHNLIGTWVHPTFSDSELNKTRSGPPSYDCETEIYITFNQSLTGTLDKNDTCNSQNEEVGFNWSIKGDQMTVVYNQQSDSNWDLISGLKTFKISGNILTIISEDGIITELHRKEVDN